MGCEAMKRAAVIVLLLVINVFASPLLFADCTNGMQDGDETGIDCGGSCPSQCPQLLSGWPVIISSDRFYSNPAVADIDPGHPGLEVIVGTAKKIYAWHSDDQTNVDGWPLEVSHPVTPSPAVLDVDPHLSNGFEVLAGVGVFGSQDRLPIHFLKGNGTDIVGWPIEIPFLGNASSAVATLGDGRLQIVAANDWGNVYVWNEHGECFDGNHDGISEWPKLDVSNFGHPSSPVIADIDPAYSGLEIIVAGQDEKVRAFHSDGTQISGWPKTTSSYVVASPAVGDIDGDGTLEVVVGSIDGKIYAWHSDSNKGHTDSLGNVGSVQGWPRIGVGTVSSAALVDLDNDKKLEVVFGLDNKEYVLRYDGTDMPGWPRTADSGTNASPSIADFDGDRKPEIVTVSRMGYLYIWHADGNLLPGFPVKMSGSFSALRSPIIADVNEDGNLEIIAAGLGTALYIWSIPSSSPLIDPTPWPQFRHDSQHTGLYVLPDTTPPSTPVVTDEGRYTNNPNQLFASWTSEDPESEIVGYQYAVGITPGGTDVKPWPSGEQIECPVHFVTFVPNAPLLSGRTYYFAVKAKNKVGLWSQVGVSDGIFVDTQAPVGALAINGTPVSNEGNVRVYSNKIIINAVAIDKNGSGVYSMELSNDNQHWTLINNSSKVLWTLPVDSGKTTLYFRVTDNVRNQKAYRYYLTVIGQAVPIPMPASEVSPESVAV